MMLLLSGYYFFSPINKYVELNSSMVHNIRPQSLQTMKYNNGQLTFDFNRSDSYMPLVMIVIVLMFGDSLFVGRSTDTKIYMLITCLFSYAFLYLLYHYFPGDSKNSITVCTEEVGVVPDTVFEHNDEASKVELKMHKEIRKVPIEESETDGEDDDDSPSPSKRKTKQKVFTSPSTFRKRKVKKQEILIVKFHSWSKHPNRWEWRYWLGWLGFEPSKIEIERGSGTHEYSLSGL